MFLGDIILNYRKEKGISQRDFAKQCNISHSYIAMLEKNIDARTGKPICPTLETIKNISIGMRIPIDDLLKMLDDEQKFTLEAIKEPIYYMAPVYGRISAGQPNWAEECIEGRLPIDPNMMNIVDPEECYFLRVNGESMNKLIKNGAYALIRKTDVVDDGDIAVVLVNGYDATLKVFNRQGDFILLEPMSTDPLFKTQVYGKDTEIKVIGKYIGKMEMK